VTTNAMSIYPSHVALNASYEGITNEDIVVIQWVKDNLDINQTLIASDHRLARMVESFGFKTTLDETFMLWDAINFSDYVDELYGEGKNHSKITHVIIDDIMKERVVHVGFGKIVYMTNESYQKFCIPTFQLLYRNATKTEDMREDHWTEVYQINWSYVASIYPLEF
jgi:hypothetical protein